jgi:hypothetical protein
MRWTMTKVRKKPSRLAKALLETAAGMRKSSLLDRAAYDKITTRHLGPRSIASPQSVRRAVLAAR